MNTPYSTSFLSLIAPVFLGLADLHAQGTVYISNLGASSTGSAPAASDSWIAQAFIAGANAEGYALDSVQLLLAPPSGVPADLTVSIYNSTIEGFPAPGTPLAVLSGPSPAAGGVFTYSAPNVRLLRNFFYFLVITGTTPRGVGSFNWSTAMYNPHLGLDGWELGFFYYSSADGQNWSLFRDREFQFAISATPVPEPSWSLLVCCGGLLLAALSRRPQGG